jgi:hypothetical protein
VQPAVSADAELTGRTSVGSAGARVWLVFTDLIANRVFFECGIVDELYRALPDRLTAVFLVNKKHVQSWLGEFQELPLVFQEEFMPADVAFHERVLRRLDRELDERIGFYPLAIRHSLRNGFHGDRLTPGHPYPFLDSSRVGSLPRWETLENVMRSWHLSGRRYVPSVLLERMRAECDVLVLTNPQAHSSMPFLSAARRLALPTVGYIASWDHPVGKGVVSPFLDRYIVQNETMLVDLERFHGIDPTKIVVTGWPQTDVYSEPRPREEFEGLLRRFGLSTDLPVVLYAGNAPNNAPLEGNLVNRLVSWWRETGAYERYSLLFRPHPYDNQVDERYAAALADPDAAVQIPALADLGDLATLLQHVDVVVANAGTILLESLVNDRPAVCVAFDEGAPPGDRWASLNLTGEHYRKLAESDAFYRAESFADLVEAVGHALDAPEERRSERERVVATVVGRIDGRASERVAAATLEVVDAAPQRSLA